MRKNTNEKSNLPSELESHGSEFHREKKVREGFWGTLKKAAKKMPFLRDVIAAYYCAFDEQTPTRVRWMLMAGLAYFVTPVDAIPDFLLSIGFMDDVTVLMVIIRLISKHITSIHFEKADKILNQEEVFDDDN